MDPEQSLQPPALLTRLFGWTMLATLVTYLLNNYLTIDREFAGAGQIFVGNFSIGSLLQLCIYLVGFALAAAYVYSDRAKSLRDDAKLITGFNTYLIRGCFWAVLLVGLADMSISFLRVEGILGSVFSTEMVKELGRPIFRGLYVHYPLVAAGFVIALFTRTLGFHWLALLIVAAELIIVITRFIFSYEQAFMGDLVRFWYAALFLFASAYTLLHEGHVRVDVFYAGFTRQGKGRVNTVGAILFGMALCWTILIIGFKSKASIIYGPINNFEVSQSGFGMYTKYLMAGYLAIFAISMLIQFVSQLFDARADVRNDPGAAKPGSEEIATH
ncbi:MAG: TRAP-type mannitol/chloroaromatic compound transport system permease small subunit [Granulosicoccus sp.]|jgi:TRAP-type mannitol/chloroaromatic compound transport system permease small subunit